MQVGDKVEFTCSQVCTDYDGIPEKDRTIKVGYVGIVTKIENDFVDVDYLDDNCVFSIHALKKID